jgi:hypothetical protein
MKKLTSTISHIGVIGLALFALLIATIVWLFERGLGSETCHSQMEYRDAAISMTSDPEILRLPSEATVQASAQEVSSNVLLRAAGGLVKEQFRGNQPVE